MADADLAFIARQLERLVNDVGALKDDMTVVMARLERIDDGTRAAVDRMEITSRGVLDELRAMHRRHDRLAKRVDRLENADREVPS
jgi:ubiquinone biosynthesis protein UbiJ